MNRKSRSIARRSSILKIDVNRDDDTGIIGGRNRRSSRRVSFAEMCQIKEFQKDSPKVFKDIHPDDDNDGNHMDSSSNNHGITGLDKLLTGAIQTPYQDVAEYPIPEMSSDSFNIFDFNKTVLDHVDMDTTEASGGIDSLFPQMDFQSEPSMELKFDAKSFLQSLQGNSSDSLKTMQIYSPKRDRYLQEQTSPDNQNLSLHFNNMGPDKENMVPRETLQSFRNSDNSPEALKYFEDEEPQVSIDSRNFLQRVFGEKTKKLEETKHDVEEMEETACIDVKLTEVDEVHMNRSLGAFAINENVTKYFNADDITIGIEETKCVGGIIGEAGTIVQNDEANKENLLHQPNQTVHMEETRPIGGILKSGQDTVHMEETRPIGGIVKGGQDTVHMEETRPIGGIVKGGQDTVHTEETRPIGGILKGGQGTVHLEETKPFGGILKGGQDTTIHMEETKPIGGILKGGLDTTIQMGLRMKPGFDTSINFDDNVTRCFKMEEGADDGLEETKCVGGILSKVENTEKNINENEVSRINQSEATLNDRNIQSLGEVEQVRTCSPVEAAKQKVIKSISPSTHVSVNFNVNDIQDNKRETKALIGTIKDTTMNIIRSDQISDLNETADDSVAMEETKAVGGLLDKTSANVALDNSSANYLVDKTIDYTVAMEETKALGGILDKTNKSVLKSVDGTGSVGSDITLNQTAPIEETKTVGGILNKISDQTMYFDDVNTDWISNDLKASSVCGKAAYGISIEGVNKSAAVEETKCVGGILTNDMEMIKENIYNYANVKDTGNKTLMEPVHMEETRCVTNVLASVVSPVSIDKEESMCLEKEKDGKSEENNSQDSQNNDLEVDDEITFKVSNKRNFDECRGESLDNKNEEKTKDFTQNQTNLAKLKEMLILSKRKTAAQVRQGDIRTPSKFSPLFPASAPQSSSKASCCSQLDLSVTRSPVNKRQRLSEAGQGVDDETYNDNEKTEATEATAALLGGFEDDNFTTGLLESSNMQDTDMQGIDDELMPDTLHHDLCNLNSSNETHSEKNSTACSDPVSTTMYENNETQSSGNDTRSSASANMSTYSNKSTLSFIAPEGPMTLESFFKLTFKPSPKVQGARCSTVFSPKLDLDDLTEVLHAELTLDPQVKAKKKMITYFTQLLERSKANMEWLEKSLEETQPEIFQLCSKASSEELKEIIGRLGSLVSACHNEADVTWKQKSEEIFTEALEDIQVKGVRRAEEMLEKNKKDHKALDDLLTSLDQDLESLDKTDQLLEELQLTEEKLNKEFESLSVSLQEKAVEEIELHSQLQHVQSQSKIGETYDMKKQEIISHLICCEWNLDELEEDVAVFTFLDEKIKLCINFILGAEEKQISDITLKINSSSRAHTYLEDKVACVFILNGINTDNLKQRFTTYSSLPKLIHEVSVSINEIKMFCKDLENVNIYNRLKFEDNSISTELWDRKTMDFINASFIFDPTHPLTNHVETKVHVRIGSLKPQFIENRFKEVTPGPGYLSRLIKAINFKQLRMDSSTEL